MILLYIFLIGCFITGIVALGVIFALAAAGFGESPREAERPSAEVAGSTKRDEPRASVKPHE